MKKIFYILVSSMSLIILVMFLFAPGFLLSESLPDFSGEPKIDASLRKELSLGSDEIPFIMLFNQSRLASWEKLQGAPLHMVRRYDIIPGVAAMGSPGTIRRLAREQWIEGLYLDGSVFVSGPVRSEDDFAGESSARMVNASYLWSQGINGSGVIVAVLDSGINQNHPDLIGKVVGEVNFVKNEETTNDLLGHGTMVAGIIAGSGEASGGKYVGVAPGAKLLNVRVIDSEGDGRDSDIIAGIEWALNNGADIISLSLGGLDLGETNLPVTMAADNAMDAGAIVCVAAGNSG